MKALEYDLYGPPAVLQLRDVPRPVPRRGEVLVRVRAAALNPKDVYVRSGRFRLLSGRRFPKRVGFDWAGEVVELGPGVRGLEPGGAYLGMLGGFHGGACAEYLAVDARACAPKPPALGFEEAAALPLCASTALQALRDVARLEPGMRLLVNGASGGVGAVAIQLGKLLGAHVTTTSSAANLALCRRLGADVALDHRAADPLAGQDRFDAIFDVFGNRSFRAARAALTARGVYVSTVPRARNFLDAARTLFAAQRARVVVVRPRARDLALLARHAAEGRLVAPVAQVCSLDEVAEAEDQLARHHPGGKIVVRVA